MKRNLCGFVPSTIEIIDVNRGKIFLNFGDIEIMDPRNITSLCLSNFTNLLDLASLNQVMKDERVNSSFKSAEMNYLISIQSLPRFDNRKKSLIQT